MSEAMKSAGAGRKSSGLSELLAAVGNSVAWGARLPTNSSEHPVIVSTVFVGIVMLLQVASIVR